MKAFEANPASPANKAAPAEAAAPLEANVNLKQRLWQLLLPLPDKAAALDVAATSADSTADRRDEPATRARNAASELAATAYLLAGHVQQLSLFEQHAATAQRGADSPHATTQPAVNLRVDVQTASGGLASLEISHPELGQVSLAVELTDGAVRVTATALSARSAEVIAQGQALLAQRLALQGIVLEALEVVVVQPKRRARDTARPRSARDTERRRSSHKDRES